MNDLEEATELGWEAIDGTLERETCVATHFNFLGSLFRARYSKTGDPTDLADTISCLQSALLQSNASVLTRIDAGISVLRLHANAADWPKAYQAAEVAVPLVPKLLEQSMTDSEKQHLLIQAVGLASNAAAMALQVNKGPLVVLTFLEQGRGVLAASLEEIRLDILDLQRRHPELAENLSLFRTN